MCALTSPAAASRWLKPIIHNTAGKLRAAYQSRPHYLSLKRNINKPPMPWQISWSPKSTNNGNNFTTFINITQHICFPGESLASSAQWIHWFQIEIRIQKQMQKQIQLQIQIQIVKFHWISRNLSHLPPLHPDSHPLQFVEDFYGW